MCISCKSFHLATPAGLSVDATLDAVMSGVNPALKLHKASDFNVAEPVMASLFDRDEIERTIAPGVADMPADATLFERLCVWSAREALRNANVDPASPTTLIMLSSTKGNIGLLENNPSDPRLPLSHSARVVAAALRNPNEPIVVSNACVSGLSAIATASSFLVVSEPMITNVVIIGCDLINRFIISGFQSFKALSTAPCRPYDAQRSGLNLGEGVATMILSNDPYPTIPAGTFTIEGWSQHNDANHISGPSRTGEGMYRVLVDLIDRGLPGNSKPSDNLAAIYTHGTATLYNDEMESIAIDRAMLSDIPVSAVKGVIGHTLGAAGILESILAIEATRRGFVLPTVGYCSQGTTRPVKVSSLKQPTNKTDFIKIMSGFGGTNAGILFSMKGDKI